MSTMEKIAAIKKLIADLPAESRMLVVNEASTLQRHWGDVAIGAFVAGGLIGAAHWWGVGTIALAVAVAMRVSALTKGSV